MVRSMKEIRQGDIYWININKPDGSAVDCKHPYVVIQDTILNQSRLTSTVVCALTSNLNRANEPGNILLDVGEAGLPKQSVIVVSQVSTIESIELVEYIGSLSDRRVKSIFMGMQFLQKSYFQRFNRS